MAIGRPVVEIIPEKIEFFRHMLVAIDFSPASRRALACAVALAEKHQSRVSVVHVGHADWRYEMLDAPPEVDLEQSDEVVRIKALIQESQPNHEIATILIRSGRVVPAVASAISETSTDLLVIATHGRGGVPKLAFGSVAEELLRVAPCPVLTVGPKVEMASAQMRAILFATDFGASSMKAVPLAVALANSEHAKLIMVHMLAPVAAPSTSLSAYAPAATTADEVCEWERSSRKRGVRELQQCLPPNVVLEEPPDYIVGTDFLPEGILMAAEKYKADLIIMGAHHAASSRVAAHNPWTAVHEVIRGAHCPVLTVAA